jgi:hypothetical protein
MKTYPLDDDWHVAKDAAVVVVQARHPYRPVTDRELYEEIGIGKTAYFRYEKRCKAQHALVELGATRGARAS